MEWWWWWRWRGDGGRADAWRVSGVTVGGGKSRVVGEVNGCVEEREVEKWMRYFEEQKFAVTKFMGFFLLLISRLGRHRAPRIWLC